jgi:hypothetical protein
MDGVVVVPTKKSVHIEIVAFPEARPLAFPTMVTLLFSLRDCFRARALLKRMHPSADLSSLPRLVI